MSTSGTGVLDDAEKELERREKAKPEGLDRLKPLNLFREIYTGEFATIPCFRETFMYGIGAGMGTYMVYVFFTNRPIKAMNYMFLAFAGVTVPYFIYCNHMHELRKRNAKEFFEDPEIKKLLRPDFSHSDSSKKVD